MTLPVQEFLRRFLLHLLPRGFMRIRNFGFLPNRQRPMLLPLCFRSLRDAAEISTTTASPVAERSHSLGNSPVCGGTMHVIEHLSAARLPPHKFRFCRQLRVDRTPPTEMPNANTSTDSR